MGVPARIFAISLRCSPAFIQNRLWKWWYQRISKAHNKVDFRFMNYGYLDEDKPVLEPEDEPYRLFIQLYEINIWPGFVDILGTILIVTMFTVLISTITQIYFNDQLEIHKTKL